MVPQPSRWSTSSSSDASRSSPPVSLIKTKRPPASPPAEGTSEGEHRRITQTPSPVNSPTREASTPELDLSLGPFGHKPQRFGSEDHEGDVDSVEGLSSLSAVPRPTPARRSTSSSAASATSPLSRHMVTSRFSQDSTTEDDDSGKPAPRERTNSIISLKSVRNLLRRSGSGPNPINTTVIRHNGLPLMSPGLNGHKTPQTRFNEDVDVPPVPSMGYFQHGSGVMPILSSPSKAPTGEKHHRPDSGLDPFHFDQESRYPVRRNPSPANGYNSDLVPPTASSPVVAAMSPTTPTTPTISVKTKGILKGWASRPKRTDSASNSISSPSTSNSTSSPIESPLVTQGKKRPANTDLSGATHNVSESEFAPAPHTAVPGDRVSLGITEKQGSSTSLLQSPVVSESRESTDTTTRLSDFEIVSPAPPGRPRRGTINRM